MSGSYGSLVHVGRDILAKDIGHRGTAAPVVCPPRTHCALRALLHHPRVRGWCSSGSAAWGPAQAQATDDPFGGCDSPTLRARGHDATRIGSDYPAGLTDQAVLTLALARRANHEPCGATLRTLQVG